MTGGDRMRICIVGKYPPIEGGVSSSTYWLAYGLAARGHEVHVVTNADQVEDHYRMALTAVDGPMLQPDLTPAGRVMVHNVEAFSRRTMMHIPMADPFVTRLATRATEAIRTHGCEVVLAYYYEPYGVAAWLASKWTDRPMLVEHAGSDLDRLARSPDLATAYKEILRDSDAVITRRSLVPRFVGMGVAPERIQMDVPYGLPAGWFNPEAEPLHVDSVALCDGGGEPPRPFDAALPTIGVYGKIGETKGTFDLIAALGRLAADGTAFNFLAMVGGTLGKVLQPRLAEAGLAERTTILPFLPNWRVPSFLRACTAVCFLERDFPVAIHGPIIAREVMACGTSLLLSGEIAAKQGYQDDLESGTNVLVVHDPKELDTLTAALRVVVDDPERARRIGKAGFDLVQKGEDFDGFVTGWERLLRAYARPPAARPAVASWTTERALEQAVPGLVHFVRTADSELLEEFLDGAGAPHPAATALDFCAFVADRLIGRRPDLPAPVLRDALRYQAARVRASFDGDQDVAPFAVADQLQGRRVDAATAEDLRPVRSNLVWLEPFTHDVSTLFLEQPAMGDALPADPRLELQSVEARPMLVLFQRTPNLIPLQLQVNELTAVLLELCDGRRTTREVVATLLECTGTGTEDDSATALVLGALDDLYRRGVVVFGAWGPAHGWRNGTRSDPALIPPLRGGAV